MVSYWFSICRPSAAASQRQRRMVLRLCTGSSASNLPITNHAQTLKTISLYRIYFCDFCGPKQDNNPSQSHYSPVTEEWVPCAAQRENESKKRGWGCGNDHRWCCWRWLKAKSWWRSISCCSAGNCWAWNCSETPELCCAGSSSHLYFESSVAGSLSQSRCLGAPQGFIHHKQRWRLSSVVVEKFVVCD